MAEKKHPDCEPCGCDAPYDTEHCKHAHLPWGGLSDEQLAILDFEDGGWWKHAGAKESAIRAAFDVSATIYYLRLNALIDRPAALAYKPLLVRRLIRLRDQRRGQRSARRRVEA